MPWAPWRRARPRGSAEGFVVWVSANLLACAALAQAPAIRLTTFYETWPGDNVAPPVRTTVTISYDAHALYVRIWAQDPDPARLRAAYADRDNVGPGDDYVALVLDTRGDGRVGMIFRVSPRAGQAAGAFNEAQFAVGNHPDHPTPHFARAAGTALDATLRPDFSQIESDVAQLSVNAQFALFYPEKRPFFLEGSDLFQTPLPVVYTRSIAAPEWGARATGQVGRTAYTLLVARDQAGGSAILPGPTQSSLVTRDVASNVGLARLRTAFSGGFIGLLGTDREGGGHNRTLGSDFLWSPSASDQFTGQLVASDTSGALDLAWHHLARHAEWLADYRDVGAGFRADDGFMPQVGVRQVNAWADAILYRSGAIFWVSPWVKWQRVTDRTTGDVVSSYRAAAIQLSGVHDLYVQLRVVDEQVRALDSLLTRRYGWVYLEAAPGRRLARVTLLARLGGDVDVANARPGRGGEVSSTLVLHASDHLELQGLADFTWLDPLFTAGIERLRASYNFTPRAALRLVVQNEHTRRDSAPDARR